MKTQSIEELQAQLRDELYVADRGLATAIYLALKLERPLFLEGEAGVGKTEIAKVLAELLDTELIRLQCYEGLDVNQAVYEWNYTRQMMHIRLAESRGEKLEEKDLFGPEFLLKRPLLRAVDTSAKKAPVLLIDEAYVDFVDPDIGYDSAQLIGQHDNVLILRTFSKGYSLAGLRLGYLLGAEDLIDPIVSKTRDSYNISHVSQQLGLAAFTDLAYAADTWEKVRQEKHRLQNNLSQLGLTSPLSQSNFLLASVVGNTSWNASQLYDHLKREGILVRFFDVTGMDDKLRITVGTVEENDRLVETLTAVLT